MFRAIMLTKADEDATPEAAVVTLGDDALPDHAVTVDVEFSTINYKDGLALTGSPGVVRRYPLVPGIDLAGTVSHSSDPQWSAGDRVVLNGWEVGESHWGGLAERARLDGGWLTSIPDALSTHQAMSIGTAGYTAMLSVLALESHGVTPSGGPIVVTGASGGVGSTAVAIAAKLGYEVWASTGRLEESDYLRGLGASEIIERTELAGPGRPLQKARWAGAIDAVGSHTLANVIAQTMPGGCVTACGLAQGTDLPATVLPFILRGVTLVGINSVYESPERRDLAWSRLATDLDADALAAMTETIGLADAVAVATRILAGEIRGRVVVDVTR